jgi:NAD(P)H-dependent FMN reductase
MSIKVVGIPGSLREGSFNRGLLRAALEVAPAEM